MKRTLSKLETVVLVGVVALLVWVSIRQHNQVQAIQLEQKKAHYAERLRTAQLILEDEMLRAAYLTTTHEQTRQLALDYLERQPQ